MKQVIPQLGDTVLAVKDLAKEYRLYATPGHRVRALLTGRSEHESHWALRQLTFDLRRGQCLGVVGNNGAGKSSLLKLLAGTLHPTLGSVKVDGRVTAILELGAGFHPDFTGRENIHFGGSLIGIKSADMKSLAAKIIEFSELGDSIDRPVKTYSSGMVVRLAFALVTAIEPDVLIVDEALAVGDQHFQKKCVERIDAFRRNGCTILFCSHSLYHVRQLCDVALWLEKGCMRAFGDTESVLAAYEADARLKNAPAIERRSSTDSAAPPGDADQDAQASSTHQRGEILSVHVDDLDSGFPPLLKSPHLAVTLKVRVQGGERPCVGLMLEQAGGVGIASVSSLADGAELNSLGDGIWQSTVTFTDLPLHTGEYVLTAYLGDSQGVVEYDVWPKCVSFRCLYPSVTPGLVRLVHHWS
ncbi:MAG: hypothetical protein RIS44_3176 [Pseudomonadota bacterium]